jgi:plasmid stabilization system protein ParE
MTDGQGFELHPGAAQDITEIWQFITEDSPPAATSFREDILEASASWWLFRTKAASGPI